MTFRETTEKTALNNFPSRSVGTEFHSVLHCSCCALALEPVEIRALLEESSEGEWGGKALVSQLGSQNLLAAPLAEQRQNLGLRAVKCQLYKQSKKCLISSRPGNQHLLIFSAKKPNKPDNPKPHEKPKHDCCNRVIRSSKNVLIETKKEKKKSQQENF